MKYWQRWISFPKRSERYLIACVSLLLVTATLPRGFAQDPPGPYPTPTIPPLPSPTPLPSPGDIIPSAPPELEQLLFEDRTAATAMGTSGTAAATSYDGPVGVTGIFNGNVTTGCSYDPLNHNAHRIIDDIVVPGSVGKYPLKMTRYLNTRLQYYAVGIGLGPSWEHEYGWLLWGNGTKVIEPSGATNDFYCHQPVGVSEGWESHPSPGNGVWRLADGGRVVFTNGSATSIIDPYGQVTIITRNGSVIGRVTEPGGRYLKFIYNDSDSNHGGALLLTRVEAYDGPANHLIDWVNYTYAYQGVGGTTGKPMKALVRVDYSDGNHADYTYRTDNVAENAASGTFKYAPLVATCDDGVRYNGPMRQIAYDYGNSSGVHGAILAEKYGATGPAVSSVGATPVITSFTQTYTETRADTPNRAFTYNRLHLHSDREGTGGCPDYSDPAQEFILNYTDFQGHTTSLGYDANWFVNSVQDARGYTTDYVRGATIGEVQQIIYPPDGNANRQSVYYRDYPDPHYVKTRTDERGGAPGDPNHTTTYNRDGNYRVTSIDYPPDINGLIAHEYFTYDDATNGFGQVLTHRLPDNKDANGNVQPRYKHFVYDSRGLLRREYNVTTSAAYPPAAPFISYAYWGNDPVHDPAGWFDRVRTKTFPANCSGYIASQTYEYDRDTSGNACAGRGLVTKITHADNTYQTFGYDIYGNKLWQENENVPRERTNYQYDTYNRLTNVTDPLGHATTYSYESTNGTNTSPTRHTTNSPRFVTDPAG